MSLLPRLVKYARPVLATRLHSPLSCNLTQIRTATKKVSGSKTNMSDSAGRRLGPKANESQFVKPGTIIMRQRGTVIHPGENTRLGTDHTIYAVEPGYVRFYRDPFHPMRKYVGVALTKDMKLPHPHFLPRMRRFGYELILDPEAAKREETEMSRKEMLTQPDIRALRQAAENERSKLVAQYKSQLVQEYEVSQDHATQAAERYYFINKYTSLGMSNEKAKIQATYNVLLEFKLKKQRGEIDAVELESLVRSYRELAASLDSLVSVDAHGKLYAYVPAPELARLKSDTIERLRSEYYRLLNATERDEVRLMIATPGLFSAVEQESLLEKYIPSEIPISIPGAVIEGEELSRAPPLVRRQRIYDRPTGRIKTIGRPPAVFHEE